MKRFLRFLLGVSIVYACFCLPLSAQIWVNGQPATIVIGQTAFPGNTPNFGGTTQGVSYPDGVVVGNGKLFVSDRNNHRVLRYNLPLTGNYPTPDLVFGQSTATGNAPNNGGAINNVGFNTPIGLAYNAATDELWVADLNNNRVLRFGGAAVAAVNGPPANLVLGQGSFGTGAAATSINGFNGPHNIALDINAVTGKVYVADLLNNRVLRFDANALSNGMNAECVFGQPNYTSSGIGVAANLFNAPSAITVDAGRNLYVSDNGNNRILRFNAAFSLGVNPNANGVFGQSTFLTGGGGLSVNQLNGPGGLSMNGTDLYVCDELNRRILRFPNANTVTTGVPPSANLVLGQQNFISNTPGISRTICTNPRFVLYDGAANRIYVTEGAAVNRVLVFDADLPVVNTLAPPLSANNATPTQTITPTFSQAMNLPTANNFFTFGGMTGLKLAPVFGGGGTTTPNSTPPALTPFQRGELVEYTLTTGSTVGNGVSGSAGNKPYLNNITGTARPVPFVGSFRTATTIPPGGPNFVLSTYADVSFGGGGAVKYLMPVDYDGDGYIDFGAYAPAANNIAVRGNINFGNFVNAVPYIQNNVVAGRTAGRFADMNNDGKSDFITTDATSIGYNLNTSTPGNFVSGGGVANLVGAPPVDFQTGDFDGDGLIDAAVITTGPNQLRIMRNTGSGFALISTTALPGVPNTIAKGDFNRDGALDLAIAFPNSAFVYLNDGGGRFIQGSAPFNPIGTYPQLAVGDLNNDGFADVAAIVQNGGVTSIHVALNNGGTTFFLPSSFSLPGGFVATTGGIEFGDINGDGNLDIVAVNPQAPGLPSHLTWFRNLGGGAFAAGAGNSGSTSLPDAGAQAITLADLDGDGDLDAMVGFGTGPTFPYVAILRNEQPPVPNPPAFNPLINAQNINRATSTINAPFTNPSGNMTTATASLTGPIRVFGSMTAGRNRAGGGSWAGTGTNTVIFTPNPLPAPAAPNRFYPGELVSVSLPAFQTNATRNDRFVPITSGTASNLGGHVRQFRTNVTGGWGDFQERFVVPLSSVPPNPWGITTGDFNNDGRLDITVAQTDRLHVANGNGDGTFAAPAVYNTVNHLFDRRLATGDFNNDGWLDIIGGANAGTNGVTLALNNGSGAFPVATSIPVGFFSDEVGVADFNGDGNLDFVASPNGGATPVVRFGNGVGGFTNAPALPVLATALSCLPGDFDNDGDMDIACSAGGTLRWYRNNGQGIFVLDPTVMNTPGGRYLRVGDFNNDGWMDIIAAGIPNGHVFINSGVPATPFTAGAGATFAHGGTTTAMDIEILDADGNGTLDCIIAELGTGTMRLALNTGGVFALSRIFRSGQNPGHLVAGDFDNDGDMDFAASYFLSNFASIFINAKPPRVRPLAGPAPPGSSYYTRDVVPQRNTHTQVAGVFPIRVSFDQSVTIATASFPNMLPPNGSSAPIRIHGSMTGHRSTPSMQGAWAFFVGTTTAQYTPPAANPFRAGETVMVTVTNARASTPGNLVFSTSPTVYAFTVAPTGGTGRFIDSRRYDDAGVARNVTLGDFNNDGKIDMMQGSSQGLNVRFQTGVPPTEFTNPPTNILGGITAYHSVAADFDGDGALDVAVSLATNTVQIRRNSPLGSFGTTLFTIGPLSNIASRLAVADFDGDGDMDIALTVVGGTPSLDVYLNNGNGTNFTQVFTVPTIVSECLTAGDFDNDGDMDIATADGSNVRIWLGQGALGGVNSLFVSPTAPWIYPVVNCTEIASGDFNGDGYTDLAVSSDVTNDITILQNNSTGNGQFTNVVAYNTGSPGVVPIVGDFDGDTRLDIVAFKPRVADSKVLFYKGTGVGTFTLQSSSPLMETSNNATPVNPLGAAADIDGDGDLDLVLPLNNGRRTAILYNHQPDLAVTTTTPSPNASTVAEPIVITTNYNQSITTGTYQFPNNSPARGPLRVYGNMSAGRSTASMLGSWTGGTNTAIYTPNTLPLIGRRFFPGEKVEFISSTSVRITPPAGFINTVSMTTGTVRQFWTKAGVGPATFFQVVTPATGANPISTAVGDIDTDGDLDIVTCDASGVTVLRNNGFSNYTPVGGSPFGGGPGAVQLADVDNDGDLDMSVINSASGNILIRLNNGSGNFAATLGPFAAGNTFPVARFGDIDGDGDIDIVTANNGGAGTTISVLYNSGSGVYPLRSDFPTGGNVPNGIALGDVDNDGDLDVVVTNNGSNNVAVLLNNGKGGFAAPLILAGGWTTPTSLALGDIDADGDLDLVVADVSGNTVEVRLNNGVGNFAAMASGSPFSVPTVSNSAEMVVLADFDGDGDLDLAIAGNGSANVTVRLNNGAGDFSGVSSGSPFATGNAPFCLVSGDMDGDGDIDLVTSNNGGSSVSVLLNTTQPRFVCTAGCGPVTYVPNIVPQRNINNAPNLPTMTWQFTEPMTTATASYPSTMPGPFGQNGAIRVFGNLRGGRTALNAVGAEWTYNAPATTASFVLPRRFAPGEQVFVSVTSAKAQTGVSARPYVYGFTARAGAGPGTFYETPFSPHSAGANAFDVALGDVDNDGDLDMAVANQVGNSVTIRLNDGRGDYPNEAPGSPLVGMNSATAVKFADVNNDGLLDLIAVANGANQVFVRINSGGGNFTTNAPNSPLIGFNLPFNAALADYDADGDLDLAVSNDIGGNVIVRLNNGLGDFLTPAPGSPFAIAANTFGISAGDVDNDGDIDIVAAGLTVGAYVLFNDGVARFTLGPNIPGGMDVRAVVLGRINNDDFLDLVQVNQTSNDVTVRFNNGSGGFGAAMTYPMGVAPRTAVLADIDGDTDVDLLTANNDPFGMIVRLNDGMGNFGTFGSNSPINFGSTSRGIAAGDVDNDGDIDVIVSRTVSGQATVLLNKNPDVMACFGQALQFNGGDAYSRVATATGVNVGTGSFTVEAMIRTPVASGVFLSAGDNGINGNGFTLRANGTLGRLEFRWSNQAAGLSVNAGVNVQDNQWHHIAVVYKALPADSLFIYVDGVLAGNGVNPNPGINNIGTAALTFGSAFAGVMPNSFYAGALDEVHFWNTALAQQTINLHRGGQIESSHPNWANLQAYYRFNEGAGATTFDYKNPTLFGTLLTIGTLFPQRQLSSAQCGMIADMYAPSASQYRLSASTQRPLGTGALTYSLTGGATLGGKAFTPASNATYTAWSSIAQNGTDSFGYSVTDGTSTSTGTVRVQFTPKLQGFTVYAQVGVATSLTGTHTIFGGVSPPIKYTWIGLSGTSFNLANPAIPVITTSASVNLTLTIEDALGFTATTTVNVVALGGDALTFSAVQRGFTDGFNGGNSVVVSRAATPFTASVFRSTTLLQATTASVRWSIAPTVGGTGQFQIQGSSQATLSNSPTFSTNATFVWRNAPPQGGSTQAVVTLSTTNGLLIFATQITVTVIAQPAQALALAASQISSTGTQGVNFGAFNQGQLVVVNGRPFNVAFGAWNGWSELTTTQSTVRASLAGSGGETDGFVITSATVILNNTSSGIFTNLAIDWLNPLAFSTTVTLRIQNISGAFLQSTSVNLTLTTTPLEPVITSFAPTTGATSSVITLQGLNLANVTMVRIGGVPVSSFTINSPTQVTVIVSTGATGLISAMNIAGTGFSLQPFTFVSPPSALVLSSTQAGVGQTLTISGVNLVDVQAVFVGGVPAMFTSTNGQIILTIPMNAQSGVVTVQTQGGSSVSPPFTVLPSPVITGFSPASVGASGMITITGANLTNVTSITVGGVPVASFMVISSTQIVAVLSANASSGLIQAQSQGGTAFSPTTLTVNLPPTLTSISNTMPVAGTQVFITGTNFTAGMTVSIGGVPVPVQVNSPSQAIITIPGTSTSGTITVTTPFGSVSSMTVLTVVAAPLLPTNIDFTPDVGRDSTRVTITGQGFINVREVRFGGVAVRSFTVENAGRIIAMISTGATGTVSVSTTTGTATSQRIFRYITPLQADSLVLVGFYRATNGNSWTTSNNWLSSLPIQFWSGVGIQNGRVTSLNLPYNAVNGSLTSAVVQLSALSALQTLNLSGNGLAGELPATIGTMRSLRNLSMSNIGLSGILPREIALLDSLETLRLDSNSISGSLEEVLCMLGNVSSRESSRLREVRLNNNRMTGAIPPCIVEFRQLTHIHLQNNFFTGGIPERIVELTRLKELVLANNRLSGTLPRSFDRAFAVKAAQVTAFQTLERLDIAQNSMTGAIPSGITQFSALRELRLNDNRLSGDFPQTFPALFRLEILDISRNTLTGTLPENIGLMRQLRQFLSSKNQMGGAIPASIADCEQLQRLELDSNRFEGVLPEALSAWQNLRVLDVSANRLTAIPTLRASRQTMEALRIASNRLTFESIEGNVGIRGYRYSPQDSVGIAQNLAFQPARRIELTMNVGGTANRYQWFKNGVAVSATSASATFLLSDNASLSDAGLYECRITNTIAPELTLFSRAWNIRIDVTAPPPVLPNPVAQPFLQYPPNATRFVPYALALRWARVEGAVRYDVQVATTSTFSAPLLSASVMTTTQSISELRPSVRYFWRVRAVGADGAQSAWSQAFFTTANSERPLQMTSIDFDRVPLRETVIREALVTNFSSIPQILNDITIVSDARNDTNRVFRIIDDVAGIVIPAGESLTIRISFTPRIIGSTSASSILSFQQRSQDGARRDSVRNILQGVGGALKMDDIDFDTVRTGGTTLRTADLVNLSQRTIRLKRPNIPLQTENGVFTIEQYFGTEDIQMKPFDTVQVIVRCTVPEGSAGRKLGGVLVFGEGDSVQASIRAVARPLRLNDIVVNVGVKPLKDSLPPGSGVDLRLFFRTAEITPVTARSVFRVVEPRFEAQFRMSNQVLVLDRSEALAYTQPSANDTRVIIPQTRWNLQTNEADTREATLLPIKARAVAGTTNTTRLALELATFAMPIVRGNSAVFMEPFTQENTFTSRVSLAGGKRLIGTKTTPLRVLTLKDALEISYTLSEAGAVELALYDVLGKKVQTLSDAYQEAGEYSGVVATDKLITGAYFLVLKTVNATAQERVQIIR